MTSNLPTGHPEHPKPSSVLRMTGDGRRREGHATTWLSVEGTKGRLGILGIKTQDSSEASQARPS